MGKNKGGNPMEQWRKKEKKKNLKRTAELRTKSRHVNYLMMPTDKLMQEIRKIQFQERQGLADGEAISKKKLMLTAHHTLMERRKESEAKERQKSKQSVQGLDRLLGRGAEHATKASSSAAAMPKSSTTVSAPSKSHSEPPIPPPQPPLPPVPLPLPFAMMPHMSPLTQQLPGNTLANPWRPETPLMPSPPPPNLRQALPPPPNLKQSPPHMTPPNLRQVPPPPNLRQAPPLPNFRQAPAPAQMPPPNLRQAPAQMTPPNLQQAPPQMPPPPPPSLYSNPATGYSAQSPVARVDAETASMVPTNLMLRKMRPPPSSSVSSKLKKARVPAPDLAPAFPRSSSRGPRMALPPPSRPAPSNLPESHLPAEQDVYDSFLQSLEP